MYLFYWSTRVSERINEYFEYVWRTFVYPRVEQKYIYIQNIKHFQGGQIKPMWNRCKVYCQHHHFPRYFKLCRFSLAVCLCCLWFVSWSLLCSLQPDVNRRGQVRGSGGAWGQISLERSFPTSHSCSPSLHPVLKHLAVAAAAAKMDAVMDHWSLSSIQVIFYTERTKAKGGSKKGRRYGSTSSLTRQITSEIIRSITAHLETWKQTLSDQMFRTALEATLHRTTVSWVDPSANCLMSQQQHSRVSCTDWSVSQSRVHLLEPLWLLWSQIFLLFHYFIFSAVLGVGTITTRTKMVPSSLVPNKGKFLSSGTASCCAKGANIFRF